MVEKNPVCLYGGDLKELQAGDALSGAAATQAQIDTVNANIALNAFRIAVAGGLSVQQMVDGVVDEFEDETGIDTAASTNEIYNGVNGLYHNVGTEAAQDSYADSNRDFSSPMSSDAGHYKALGQAITLSAGAKLSKASFSLKKAGSPTGNATVALYAATGTVGTNATPTGAALASGTFDVSTLTTSHQLIEFTFANPYNAVAGDYVVTVEYSGGGASNIVYGGIDISSPSHAGNNVTEIPAGTWAGTSIYDTIFTLTGQPISDMTLISANTEAMAEPTDANLILFIEPVDAITINTDLKGFVSLDDGTTYEQVTLASQGEYEPGRTIYSGAEPMTAAADQTMRWKLTTHNGKEIKIHGAALQWR